MQNKTMAYNVNTAFNEFYSIINLSGDHKVVANGRKDHLIGILEKRFHVVDSFGTGSIAKLTALHGHADIDIMVVLHYGKHILGKLPSEVLKDIRDSISTKTDVRRNGQAVTMYYETGLNVDIVPVFYTYEYTPAGAEKILHYNVPDMKSETWIMSKPKEYAFVMERKVLKCGSNFRRIIKMIKSWNRSHGNYLQSYHIEVLAMYVFDENIDDTTWNVFQFFEKARPLLASSLWYDTGYVDTYLTYTDRLEILKRVDTAIDKTRAAWHCTYNGKTDHETAIGLWRQVFGDKFPYYG